MSATDLSRLALAMVMAALLFAGVILGSFVKSLGDAAARESQSPSAAARSSAVPTPEHLPVEDVPGEDFAQLPRYPGSVRSGYQVDRDDRFELTAAEYLADAGIGDIRVFYQTVIAEHGWERVDIDYTDGEWAYVLLNGADEALIEIEARNGLVEIDLQLSRPIGAVPPALPDSLLATPVPAVAPPPPAAQPPPPDDDDGTDDDGWDDDSGD